MSQNITETNSDDKIYFQSKIKSQVSQNSYNVADGVYSFDFEGINCNIEISTEEDKKFLTIISNYQFSISPRRKEAFKELQDYLYLKYESGTGVNAGTIKSFVDENATLICSLPERILQRIQWRFGFSFYGEIKLETKWTLDGENWKNAVTDTLKVRLGGVVCCPETEIGDHFVNEIATLETDKPLHRSLIQNASGLVWKDARSATMLAGTALEIGLKNLLFNKHPILESFYKDSQLPPIKKILSYTIDKSQPPLIKQPSIISTYIPGFHIELSTVGQLESFINIRNQCVHQGKLDITWDRLYDFIEIIEDVLFYVDFHNGFSWAPRYIRKLDQFKFNSQPEN